MKIQEIRKKGKKYKITLDNGLQINTFDVVILNNGLLYNKIINDELLKKINKENNYYDIYYKVLNLISKKVRSEKEINDFLDKNSVSKIDKNKIIKKLKSINLINDKIFAKSYISDKINLSNDGIDKIRNDLLKHNIDLNIINEELDKIDNDLLNKKIEKLINKKLKNSKYVGFKLKYKIINELVNLGYNKEKIIEIYDNMNIKKGDLIIKEYNKLYTKLSNKYEGKELEYKINMKLYNMGFTKYEIENIQETNHDILID